VCCGWELTIVQVPGADKNESLTDCLRPAGW
jgi:hypothetical protein